MKLLTTLLLFLFISFATAQDNNSIDNKKIKTKACITMKVKRIIVIDVKGIRTIEEIDIENYNKKSYLSLIANKKQKPKTC